MAEVDRLMIEEWGIGLLQMMENAGRGIASVIRKRFLGGRVEGARITVLAGPGGNGGGALVAARRLHGRGARVRVVMSRANGRLRPETARQLRTLRAIGVPVSGPEPEDGPDGPDGGAGILVDGLIGYGLVGAPRGEAAALVRGANAAHLPIVSVDIPSGVDATSGEPADPAVRAAATVTLALPKTGLFARAAQGHVGELYLADIGVPPSLYSAPSLGLAVGPIFADGDVLRLA